MNAIDDPFDDPVPAAGRARVDRIDGIPPIGWKPACS
jgi:hypothetical protein